MKKILGFFSVLYLCSLANFVQAQRTADQIIQFDDNITDFFFHQTSGVPIILTTKAVYGANPQNGEIIWQIEASQFAAALNILDDRVGIYQTLPLTPFSMVNESIIDSRSGDIIISKSKFNYKKIISHQLLEDNKLIVNSKGQVKNTQNLFYIDILTGKLLWHKNINTAGASSITNLIQHQDKLFFTLKKQLVFIETEDGTIILDEKADIGTLVLNQPNQLILAVEAKGGSIVGTALKVGFTAGLYLLADKKLGEKVWAYHIKDGSKAWKKKIKLDGGYQRSAELSADTFYIKHEEGANVYNYADGKPVWKKDFKKNVRDLQPDPKGYMVFYGSKKLLLDERGKKIWKKPQKVRNNVQYDIDEEDNYSVINYAQGDIVIRPDRVNYFEHNKKKSTWKLNTNEKSKLAYDRRNNSLIVLNGKWLYVLNPDKGLGKDQGQRLALKKHKYFHLLETRTNSYFISSPWEYVVTDFSGKVLVHQYYDQPGEDARILGNVAAFALASYGAYSQVSGIMGFGAQSTAGLGTAMYSGEEASSRHFAQADKYAERHQRGVAAVDLAEAMSNPDRYNAFAEDRNSTFYFTEFESDAVLVQVDKDNGEELDKFIFYDNKPKYEIDPIEKIVYYRKGKELHIYYYE